MAIKQKYKAQLLAIIHKHLPKCKVYLFGSQATGKSCPGSDIDIAIDCWHIIPHKTIIAILVDIDDTIIPMKVDLVDMCSAQENIKQEIVREGILWTN